MHVFALRRALLAALILLAATAVFGPGAAWAAGDGVDTPGVARATSGGYEWDLTNTMGGSPLHSFLFHSGGTPVVGDWDGDGVDTPGVVLNGNHWILTNGYDNLVDYDFYYGNPGDTPIVGDWNGDGIDTPGVRRTHYWYLSNGFDGSVAYYFGYGNDSGDTPVVGDWNGDGIDTVGVRRTHYWYLSNDFAGTVDYAFGYGNDYGDTPVVGDWDNDPADPYVDTAISNDAGTGDRQLSATASPVARYAPRVWIYSGEQYFPGSARLNFMRHSELRWSNDQWFDDKIAGRGQVRAVRLGVNASNPYSHRTCDVNPYPTCRTFYSYDYTRPRGHEADRNGLFDKDGFFLDPKCCRGGVRTLSSDPVYYDYQPYRYVTYWFFYPYDDGEGNVNLNHEGDWERISVHLDANNNATQVRLYRHTSDCNLTVDWSNPYKVSGTQHPIIYSAGGTHGSYSRPGTHDTSCASSTWGFAITDDKTDAGYAWDTWNRLADVRAQPWYGFGGAWGEIGNWDFTTGPLGPSRYKVPSPW